MWIAETTQDCPVPIAQVNGTELYYELQGSGPPVLVIPGLGGDVRMFSWLVTAIAASRRVLALDPRGGGRSAKPRPPYSIDQMADDAVGMLQSAGMDSATVLGYSMGGRIALNLALRHPERVTGLVLAATSARTLPVRPFTRRWLIDVLGATPLPRFIDPQPRYAHIGQRQATRDFDCTAQLGQIDVPTVVVHGRNDHVTPFHLGEELQQAIPHARLVPVGGGHFSLLIGERGSLIDAVRAASA